MTFSCEKCIISLVVSKGDLLTTNNELRKCRNWQTSKTKDLVTFVSCGFKSHLPHENHGCFSHDFFYGQVCTGLFRFFRSLRQSTTFSAHAAAACGTVSWTATEKRLLCSKRSYIRSFTERKRAVAQVQQPLNQMRKMGLEPTRYCYHKILSLARLPVPTLPHESYLRKTPLHNTSSNRFCQQFF